MFNDGLISKLFVEIDPSIAQRTNRKPGQPCMHVILGLMKKILEWMRKLFAKLEALEEEATVGFTTFQFRQAIVEARGSAAEHAAFLKTEFKSTIEGRREETLKLMKELGKTSGPIQRANLGAQQGAAIRRLEILKSECKKIGDGGGGTVLYNFFTRW